MKTHIRIVAIASFVLALFGWMLPAQAAPGPVKLVSLGDSFASGLGGANYDPASGPCLRSANSAAQQLARQLQSEGKTVQLTDVSCAGATVPTVRQTQLGALSIDTTLVVVFIGGNDAGFGSYGETCVNGDCAGQPTMEVLDRLDQVRQAVQHLLTDIASRAPHARVILGGYGQLLTPLPTTPAGSDPICPAFSPGERLDIFKVQTRLDWTLWEAALLTVNSRIAYVSSYAAAPVLRPAFTGKSLCGAIPPSLYHGFDVFGSSGDGLAPLHPKTEWYTLMAGLLRQKV